MNRTSTNVRFKPGTLCYTFLTTRDRYCMNEFETPNFLSTFKFQFLNEE